MYTTKYLLNNANTVTELCIKDKEEFRIWKEMKIAFKEIGTNMENKNIQEESKIKLLRIVYTDIIIELDVIKIIKER